MDRFNVAVDGPPVAKNCEKHGAYEARVVMLGDRKLIAGLCPACQEINEREYEERIAREQAILAQEQAEKKLTRAGIPLRFRSRTLDRFAVENEGQKKALQVADDFLTQWEQHRKAGTMVVFSGPPGTGKSHLAIGIALELMSRGVTAFYVNAIDAIRLVRDTWRKDSERSELDVLHTFASVGLLVLDEVGMQFGTDSEQIQIFDIINRRYQDNMPTILLTNLGKSGLKDFLGDRSFDRLREDGIWTVFDWESWRPKMRNAD